MNEPMRELTADEAAQRLRVSVRTLGRYVADGRITPRRRTAGSRGPRLFLAFDVERLARGECVHCGSTAHTIHP